MKNTILVCLLMTMTASFAHADLKIAIVDMQKIVQSSFAGKKAKTILEEEFNKKKKELEKKEAELKKISDEIEKKKPVLSEDILRKRQNEFQEEMAKYRQFFDKSQADIQKRQAELSAPIIEKINKIVDRLTKEKAYDLVLEKNAGVLRAASSLNISDEVLKLLESEK